MEQDPSFAKHFPIPRAVKPVGALELGEDVWQMPKNMPSKNPKKQDQPVLICFDDSNPKED